MKTEEKWYCSSYGVINANGNEIFPDCDYFTANDDESAIEIAKSKALAGVDYVDEGHFELDLISVCRVDSDNDFIETETIWY